jgi:pimeloyl-ACP methyl ester carboxylesterase
MAKLSGGVTAGELAEVERANASGKPTVVFVHGLWLLPSSWDLWREYFEIRGYSTIAPGWPNDPATVGDGRLRPQLFARKSIGDVTDHIAEVITLLDSKPAIIGHSFGGLITQKLAGLGVANVSVAIDSAPFRGVLPLPLSSLKAAFPVLGNPTNRKKSVMLTYDQFRFAFANAVTETEAKQLYDTFAVPGSGIPLFQAALANLYPATEAKVDSKNSARGPLKIISGELDNTAPFAIANASYKLQKRNTAVTEIEVIKNRGHSLTIDSGWEAVAQAALDFVVKYGR